MKKFALLLAGCLGMLLLAAWATAEEKAAGEPKPDPALDQKIDGLIKQLDDNSSAVRDAATTGLIQIGAPALPKLREAYIMSGSNAEVHTRIHQILLQIAPPPKHQAARVSFHGNLNMWTPTGPRSEDSVSTMPAMVDLLSGFGMRVEVTAGLCCVIDLKDASQADKLGIKSGDFLMKANQQALTTTDEAKTFFTHLKADAPLTLEIRREAKTITLKR